MANFDNVFTKKYRRWNKEGKKDFNALKSSMKTKKKARAERKRKKQLEKQAQKEVQAEIKKQETVQPEIKKQETIQEIKTQKSEKPTDIIQPLDFEDQSLFDPVYIKKHKKNNLTGEYDPSRPPLRDYDKL